jgi:hypothetical protein
MGNSARGNARLHPVQQFAAADRDLDQQTLLIGQLAAERLDQVCAPRA